MIFKKTAIPLAFFLGLVSLSAACQPSETDGVDPMTEEAPTEQPAASPDEPIDPAAEPEDPTSEEDASEPPTTTP